MKPAAALIGFAALLIPLSAHAGPASRATVAAAPLPVTVGGQAPWNAPWEYDSGGDNDRRPELPYYQQGRGQQTGGPARNLLPDDGLHFFPR